MSRGFNPKTQSTEIRNLPYPCGSDVNPAIGREPGQTGWYVWIADMIRKELFHTKSHYSILDVGAGTGFGTHILHDKNRDSHVIGIDPDPRLSVFNNPMIRTADLTDMGQFDVVVMVDVIEHVVDDLELLKYAMTRAKSSLYVTTPNGQRPSTNLCHCRELTLTQAARYYKPDEIWVGSPDGWHNVTLAAVRHENTEAELVYRLPIDKDREWYPFREELTLQHTSVDRLEWPHACYVWRQR